MSTTSIGKLSAQATLDASGFKSGIDDVTKKTKGAMDTLAQKIQVPELGKKIGLQALGGFVAGFGIAGMFSGLIETLGRGLGELFSGEFFRRQERAARSISDVTQRLIDFEAIGRTSGRTVQELSQRLNQPVVPLSGTMTGGMMETVQGTLDRLERQLALQELIAVQNNEVGLMLDAQQRPAHQMVEALESQNIAMHLSREAMEEILNLQRGGNALTLYELRLQQEKRKGLENEANLREKINAMQKQGEQARAQARSPLQTLRDTFDRLSAMRNRGDLSEQEMARLLARDLQSVREGMRPPSLGGLEMGGSEVAAILASSSEPQVSALEALRALQEEQKNIDVDALGVLQQIRDFLQPQPGIFG